MNQLVIRTSDRGLFKQCRQKWDFSSPMRMGYEPVTTNKHLGFGTAVHKGLEVYYEPSTWELVQKPDTRGEVEHWAHLAYETEFQTQFPVKPGAEDTFPTWADRIELVDLGHAMLTNYFSYAQRDTWTPLHSEVEFEVPIPGLPGVVYQGRVDLIVRVDEPMEDENGAVYLWPGTYLVDHKTTSRFDDTAHLDLDQQCSSYVWALRQELGLAVQGIVYNELLKAAPTGPKVLKSGKLSTDKRQRCTPEQFLLVCEQTGQNPSDYQDYLNYLYLQKHQYVRRTTVMRTESMLAKVEWNIQQEAMEMTDQDLPIYPNPSRWNCNGCPYRSPCLMAEEGVDPTWELEHTGLYKRKQDA